MNGNGKQIVLCATRYQETWDWLVTRTGKVYQSGGGLIVALENDGQNYQLSKAQMKKIHKDDTVDVGIRGYDITISNSGYPATVEYTEVIESDLVIHVITDDRKLTVVEKADNGDTLKYFRDQEICLSIDMDRLHIFDQEGNRL